MNKIELRNIRKSYGSTLVIQDVSLEIRPNELFFLLGPSGCGKTTLLRMVAGFIAPDAGDILLDGQRVNELPPEKRRTPMVFQNYALWPHLSVFENVAYGLRLGKLAEKEIRRRTMDALSATRMSEFAERSPTQLSGGQQQRVAISRALAVDPGVLLFDEPLSNLDARLRVEMRQELLEIHRRRPFTAIYVTHDQEEAMTLATRIAVLDRGVVHQVGSPQELFTQPKNRFVAEFIGPINWISAEVQSAPAGLPWTLQTPFGVWSAPAPREPQGDARKVLVGFRPAAGVLVEEGRRGSARIRGSILHSQYTGASQRLLVKSDPGGIDLQVLEHNPRKIRAVGDAVEIAVAQEDLLIVS